jgi:hypothetical protein
MGGTSGGALNEVVARLGAAAVSLGLRACITDYRTAEKDIDTILQWLCDYLNGRDGPSR